MISRDNGGASMFSKRPTSRYPKYYKIVSRFDRKQIDRLRRLDELLRAEDSDVMKGLFRMTSKLNTLKVRVSTLLDYVDKMVARHGEADAYFTKPK